MTDTNPAERIPFLPRAFVPVDDQKCGIATVQDCNAILDNNQYCLNHTTGYTPSRDLKRVASIPLVVAEKWLNELGVDVFNKDHHPRVMALLDDPDWSWLRTSGGRIGHSDKQRIYASA